MIDKATVDRIYSAADIVEVIGDFVTLKKKGVNYQACCPFHNEKTPSFVVSPSKGLFKCFGCGKGGNAVTFVMEHENMTYPEALKYVAKKYGIEVAEREQTPEEQRRNDDRESMMVVSSYAADYFVRSLHDTPEGRSVGIAYFRERGFSDATIRKFGLGYCPAAGDTFTRQALADGYKEQFLVGTGLTIKRETGGYYDRFCGRVMFPIHSIGGRVTAFGGRTMRTDKKVAKYLNSPESEIYHKSDVLYGLYHAKRAIVQQDCCILVEGYTDVIQMHQSGVENVVASSGTSLTEGQIRLIGRFTRNVTVIYDGDSAGIKASLRGIDMLLREGLNVRVVLLPDGDDPDSFARKRNATELQEFILKHEEDFISFKTRLLMSDAGNDPLRKAALVTDIVQSISVIPDAITRSVYTRECSRQMEIDEQVLLREIALRRLDRRRGKGVRPPSGADPSPQRRARFPADYGRGRQRHRRTGARAGKIPGQVRRTELRVCRRQAGRRTERGRSHHRRPGQERHPDEKPGLPQDIRRVQTDARDGRAGRNARPDQPYRSRRMLRSGRLADRRRQLCGQPVVAKIRHRRRERAAATAGGRSARRHSVQVEGDRRNHRGASREAGRSVAARRRTGRADASDRRTESGTHADRQTAFEADRLK